MHHDSELTDIAFWSSMRHTSPKTPSETAVWMAKE